MDVLTRRRFTVEEYHRMGEARILAEDERVELIQGEIVMMTPIGPRHAGVVDRLVRVLSAERVEVYRQPTPDGYHEPVVFSRGQELAAGAFPDLTLTVSDLLG